MAAALFNLGRFDEAKNFYVDALVVCRSVYGEYHPLHGECTPGTCGPERGRSLRAVQRQSGAPRKFLKIARKTMAGGRALYDALCWVGYVNVTLGMGTKVIKLYEKALEISDASNGSIP